jgi:hypothetical protein
MPLKGDCPSVPHVELIMRENKGLLMRFSDIHKLSYEKGWRHNGTTVKSSLDTLIKQGKIVKIRYRYGMPAVREDGTKYVVLKDQGLEDEVIEIE